MTVLPLVRLISFGVIITFSVIVLGLAAHITNLSTSVGFYFTFAAMAIATVILTWAALGTMLVVGILRKGAVTSWIAIELGALGFLWVFWLATAALSAEEYSFRFGGTCAQRRGTVCGEFASIVAFSFLNWIIIFAYLGTLLVFSIIAATRGNQVWLKPVSDADFFAPATEKNVTPAYNNYQSPMLQPASMQPQYPNQVSMGPGYQSQQAGYAAPGTPQSQMQPQMQPLASMQPQYPPQASTGPGYQQTGYTAPGTPQSPQV